MLLTPLAFVLAMSDLSAAKKKTLVGLQINVGEGKATRQRQYDATSPSNAHYYRNAKACTNASGYLVMPGLM